MMHAVAAILFAFAPVQEDEVAKKLADRIEKLLDEYAKRVNDEVAKIVRDEIAAATGAADATAVARWETYLTDLAPKLHDDGVTGDFKKAIGDARKRRAAAGILAQNFRGEPDKESEKVFELDENGKVRVRKGAEEGFTQLVAAVNGGGPVTPTPRGKPYLGFSADRAFTDADREAMDLDPGEGVRVGSVAPDGPADKAGIKKGDIVLKVGGADFNDTTSKDLMAKLKPNESVEVLIYRDGKEQTVKMTVGVRN